MARRVLLLGSTGSIGRQSLAVLADLGASHRVVGLSAARSAALLSRQARTFAVEQVCLTDAGARGELDLPSGCRLHTGAEGLLALVGATEPDLVICAISGAAGLPSTLAAARAGATLALANKESMVLAGHLVKAAVAASGGRVIPVDSEHSAIAQCLAGQPRSALRRLVLTASGGPFRGKCRAELADVTPSQALRHPCWDMGPRITVDSATLMNKALEIIEACQLFDVTPEQVEVVVHPQSVIHSMVEFVDGAVLAQLSPPDMRLPIRYALGYPDRLPDGGKPVDFAALSGLTFEAPDRAAFPCLALGERAARAGGLAGTIMNAADEVAVEAFLAGRLPFLSIADVVADALDRFDAKSQPDLDEILETDRRVRAHAASRLPQPAARSG